MRRPDGDELFAEADLRRALRLETSELPPRFDPAALIARAARSELRVVSLASAVVAGSAAAVLLIGAVTLALAVVPAVAADAYAAAIGVVVWAAVPVDAVLGTIEQPAIPIAALAAVTFTIAYEYRQRKERAHVVHAS
jgi:hypothetical protein